MVNSDTILISTVQYKLGMIPQHSMAVHISKNYYQKSETDDKTIRLVESIIKTQAAEIEVFYIFEYLKMPSYKLNKCFLK